MMQEVKPIEIEGIYKNNLYEDLRNYVKEHHGFSSELQETDLYKRFLKAQEDLKQFENKKVKITYSYTNDFLGGNGFKIGKIVFDNDKIKFYEGLNRTKFYWLDFGLFDGWFATLILKEIAEVNKQEFKEYLKKQKEDKLKRRFGLY
ncbi:MAG: hypothetical protein AABY22_03025 [Nanoarchaeota archaeon]